MTAVRTALVIGGGVAGPVTAMALRKAGIDATLYEAYPTSADGIGVTLTLAPNGLRALGIIGADEAVRAIGQPMNTTIVTDGYGVLIGETPNPAVEPETLGVWRDELSRVLHEQALAQGVRVEYGKRLVDATETADGITAHFADGSTATGDVLIGADGIRSKVRTLIDPQAPTPTVMPILNFGAASRYVPPAAKLDTMYFSFGKKAFFGYWAQPDGRTAWFANVPDKRPMTYAKANETANTEWMEELREAFAEDVPAREILKQTDAADLVAIGSIESMPKVPHWYRGRMILVGDSVHGPSPSSGQGASMAVESGIQLARCLRDLPDVGSAFAAYEGLRRERVEKIILRGARTTNSKTMGGFAKTMMRIMMPLAMKTFLNPEKTLGPEQRYRIDWDARVTPSARPTASRAA
ncbi:FAD-dependent monooxygenase [Micromonospora sp. RTGN7]|uniref:FAD-dependent monooxygenase n=1 Tax=Micromonospora sp. RTGN7 TaxID=3016526 RepID=UPI0029FF2367|nr:FAD-dependent monooxygenase [Micromonospora sp. RTGN7]